MYIPDPGTMAFGISKENPEMRCRVCGALLESRVTDLPFKTEADQGEWTSRKSEGLFCDPDRLLTAHIVRDSWWSHPL
jgi:hypothetical protein